MTNTLSVTAPALNGTPDDARVQLREAITVLGYDDGLYAMLASPRREVSVSIPLRRDDGQIKVLTGHRCSTTCLVAGEGRTALLPRRHPRRGARPGDVNDVQVGARARSKPAGATHARRLGRRHGPRRAPGGPSSFCAAAQNLRAGPASDQSSQIGPLISADAASDVR
jgi:hypothetical protein